MMLTIWFYQNGKLFDGLETDQLTPALYRYIYRHVQESGLTFVATRNGAPVYIPLPRK